MKRALVRGLITGAAVAAVLASVAALVVVLGLIPIKASSGHWTLTHHALEFVKRRSVATQALGTSLPNLRNDTLVLHGAGAYETNCRMCHGGPGLSMPVVPSGLLPKPPNLVNIVPTYDPEELFGIVKHGIKFTGMPAWPTQSRDDEVVAMVAFLLELPSLDATQYRALVEGGASNDGASSSEAGDEAEAPRAFSLPEHAGAAHAIKTSCARCHGLNGTGRGVGAFPKLAGQTPEYFLNALNAYADGRRPSGTMAPAVTALGEQERRALAQYYARLPVGAPLFTSEDRDAQEASRRGAEIAKRGIPNQGVPACTECHGPAGHGRNPAYPNLAGQYVEYLRLQLDLFKRGTRGGSAYAHLMHHVASRLNAEQMSDVAAYYASLGSGADAPHVD